MDRSTGFRVSGGQGRPVYHCVIRGALVKLTRHKVWRARWLVASAGPRARLCLIDLKVLNTNRSKLEFTNPRVESENFSSNPVVKCNKNIHYWNLFVRLIPWWNPMWWQDVWYPALLAYSHMFSSSLQSAITRVYALINKVFQHWSILKK